MTPEEYVDIPQTKKVYASMNKRFLKKNKKILYLKSVDSCREYCVELLTALGFPQGLGTPRVITHEQLTEKEFDDMVWDNPRMFRQVLDGTATCYASSLNAIVLPTGGLMLNRLAVSHELAHWACSVLRAHEADGHGPVFVGTHLRLLNGDRRVRKLVERSYMENGVEWVDE